MSLFLRALRCVSTLNMRDDVRAAGDELVAAYVPPMTTSFPLSLGEATENPICNCYACHRAMLKRRGQT
jgi:hypothetical protein